MSQPRSADAALRQAEAEELTLMRSECSKTGYKGVQFHCGRPKPYQAEVKRGGKKVALGSFATAEEAALAYARTPEGRAAVAAAAPPAPPPLTAEEALRQAEAEVLTLLRSESSSTGYKGVSILRNSTTKPYQAKVSRGGKQVNLGSFATAEEAALCYARSPEAQAAVAAAAAALAPPPMTAEAALRQAEAEGLTLMRTESNSTGYKGVRFNSGRPQPYQAHLRRCGENVTLGSFATAEEAALAYARSPEARAAVAAAAAPPAPPPLTAEEALRQAEAEGLTLVRSESSSTGYKGVAFFDSNRSKPYQAKVKRGGKTMSLGFFATAEEAALAVARDSAAHAAAPHPPASSAEPPPPLPMTAEEALRQAEAEGLTLLKSESSSTGYKGVSWQKRPEATPYQAKLRRGGQSVALGTYATAEEAALVVAQELAALPPAQATAPQPPPSSSLRKRKVKSEEQPPDMPAGARVKLEEQPPPMPNDARVKLEFES